MNKTYKVLKDYQDLKEGTIFAPKLADFPQEVTDQLIAEGVLEEVAPEKTAEEETQKNADEAAAQRLELTTKATALEVEFTDETTDEELIALIAAKEEKAAPLEEEATAQKEAPAPEVVKTYRGKKIVADGTRVNNGITYHEIRLEDGTTEDLTDEVYKSEVIIQE